MIRQVIQYVPARALPGLVNFAAVAIYTRLLSPAAYGRYMFVMGIAALMQTVFFHWLRAGLQRFYHRAVREGALTSLLSTIALGLILSVAVSSVSWWGIVSLGVRDPSLRTAMWLGLGVLVAEAMFQLSLERQRMELKPLRYGVLASIRAVSGLALGVWLVALWDLREIGVLVGLAVGGFLTYAIDLVRSPRVRVKQASIDLLREILGYGLPLTVSAIFTFVISTSDRLMLQYYLGEDAVGLYSAPYDLAQQALVLMFIIMNLAGYPVVVHALENGGPELAQQRLREYGVMFFALAIPMSVGFATLSPVIAELFLGLQFREMALHIMPWISFATLAFGLKGSYFDLSFQLGKRTTVQIWPVAAGATANVVFNLILIPHFGIAGAVYGSVIAYLIAMLLSIQLGRKVFPVPLPLAEITGVVVSSTMMAAVLRVFPMHGSWVSLAILIGAGVATYFIAMYVLDVANVRQRFGNWIRSVRGSSVG